MPETTCVYAALLHAPVKNRHGKEIVATVDQFDFFDMSRLSLTYPLKRLFMVQPVPAQRDRIRELIAYGTQSNRHAGRGLFDRTTHAMDLETVIATITDEVGQRPMVVATTARHMPDAMSYVEARREIATGRPILLVFGKAWGLTESVIQEADARLAPIDPGTGYNHLSVRSAVAIILDRLLG